MTAHIKLTRAVSSEFLARKLKSSALILGAISLLCVIAAFWLTTRSAWWWLLAVPAVIFMLLGLGAYLAANTVVKIIRPELSPVQITGVKSFVDKLERVAETIHTPMFIIVFRVLRDAIWPRKNSFIKTAAKDGTTLHKDFLDLAKLL